MDSEKNHVVEIKRINNLDNSHKFCTKLKKNEFKHNGFKSITNTNFVRKNG